MQAVVENKTEQKPVVFQISPHFENLIRLQTEQPKTFAVLSPSEKITLQIYLEQKRKSEAKGSK